MSDPETLQDIDPAETREWIESLEAVLEHDGPDRVRFLLQRVLEHGQAAGASPPFDPTTPYVNSIPTGQQPEYPGDLEVEERLQALLRWNAMVMVARANKELEGIGGHIGSYQSVATLFEVGFNHFFHAPSQEHGGDLVFFQGHCSPGIYARAFFEGRLDREQLANFRQEVDGKGIPSYPHPWLMPDFWQFATVSMGLGPLMAIYQARFLQYLQDRQLLPRQERKVWAFLGDGEMDEPESLGAITLASREKLGNLIFVVNCNLQRLDGPVRGNGKIVQELEGVFRGAGWRVIKVLWGSAWDPLLAADRDGALRRKLLEVVDGQQQNFAAKSGEFFRSEFFAGDPALESLVAEISDEELAALARARGGHDPTKVYAAYHAATRAVDQPTVILAQTVKGYGLGDAGEAKNTAHNVKKMSADDALAFRAQFRVPISEEAARKLELLDAESLPEVAAYLQQRREALGGPFPQRQHPALPLPIPELSDFQSLLDGSGKREISTTMAFVRALSVLIRNKELKKHLVPILADEARTFGMEGLFRQIGIYAPDGQKYRPVDADEMMFYREAEDGQMLQEGINEAGAISSWIAAGMSYSTHGVPMIPFFIYYSMFGFQRVGDFIWAAADMQARGFLIGGTSGRTTLNGEGLQHEDGHSHLIAATVPTCVAYDPTFGYELAVILQDGLRRMYAEEESVFYYITTMNENYAHPAMPEGAEEGIRKGMYLLRTSDLESEHRVQLMGSGSILREVLAAADMLEEEHGVAADVWSATSFTELRREGLAVERRNRLRPEQTPETTFVQDCLAERPAGPVIASTDYMCSFADQIRPFVDRRYVVLGTDGFGRSDSREKLRHHFEVDRRWVSVAALKALADEGALPAERVTRALEAYDIDPDKADPSTT